MTSVPNWSHIHPATSAMSHLATNVRLRTGQVRPEDFFAARVAGTCPAEAGNNRPYGGSAVSILEGFERVCSRNTHTLFNAGDEQASFIPPHMLPKHPGLKPPQLESVTLFQSSLLPAMSLVELATMLRRNTRCDKSTLCAAAILMVRFCEMTNLKPTLHMMHRMLVAALQIATKAHSDVFLRNDRAATLCGMKPAEMNRLEAHLISGCQWRVVVTHAEAVDVESAVKRMEDFDMAAGTIRPLFAVPEATDCDLANATPSSIASTKRSSRSAVENESFEGPVGGSSLASPTTSPSRVPTAQQGNASASQKVLVAV